MIGLPTDGHLDDAAAVDAGLGRDLADELVDRARARRAVISASPPGFIIT